MAVRAALGNHRPFLLPTATSGMRGAWSRSRAHPVEPWQTTSDHRDDGISGPLGAATFLARDGSDLSNQLGGGVPLGGMVRGMGLGSSGVGGSSFDWH